MKQKLIKFLIALACMAISAGAAAQTWDVGTPTATDVTAILDAEGTLTISGTGDMVNWTTFSSLPWFADRPNITKVVIEDGVTNIGNFAFYNCQNLTEISIGNSVMSITSGSNTFYGTKLTTLNVSADNPHFSSEDDVMFNKDKTELVKYPIAKAGTYTIPDGVTSIRTYAFTYARDMSEVIIPNSVTSIETYAFNYCSGLTTVIIPNSVTSIENSVFRSCTNLTGITFLGDKPSTGLTIFDGIPADQLTLYYLCGNTTWNSYIYDGVNTDCLKSWEIGTPNAADVTAILDAEGTLTISGTGMMLDFNVGAEPWYSEQASITKAVIENGVTNIGTTFAAHSNLTEISIGNSVMSIPEANRFLNCNKLTDIKVSADNPYFTVEDRMVLFNKDKTALICYPRSMAAGAYTIPDGVTEIRGYAFAGAGVSEVIIPNSVTTIGADAFFRSSITKMTISNGVTSIGNNAFTLCSRLTEIIFRGDKPAFGTNVFSNLPADQLTLYYSCGNTTWEGYIYPGVSVDCLKFWEIGTPNAADVTAILDADGTLTISGTGMMQNITSTNELWWSVRSSITKVVIEDGVTNLIPFANHSNLTEISLGDSVMSTESDLFLNCRNLTDIKVSADNPYFTVEDRMVLFNKEKTALIYFPQFRTGAYTIPYGVQEIRSYAFFASSVSEVIIPNSVTTIAPDAFQRSERMTKITIGNGVTNIGHVAFSWCNALTEIIFRRDKPTFGTNVFNGIPADQLTLYYPCGNTTWDGYTYPGVNIDCLQQTSWNIGTPNATDVTAILDADGTFTISGTGMMQDFPQDDAPWFSERANITTLVIETGIENIGNYAFTYCDALTGTLTIPEGVKSIGGYAFWGCTGFTGTLTIPEGVESIGDRAFRYCAGFTGALTIPESVKSIGEYVFDDCTGFNGTLTIPEGIKSIGRYAFDGCNGFTGTLTIPEGVESIGEGAFRYCSGFTGALTIPASIETLEQNIFRDCTGFTGTLTIPEGVRIIRNSVFSGCSGLTGTTIPASVESIGNTAFFNCTDLTEITFLGDMPSTGTTIFQNIPAGQLTLYYPCGNTTWDGYTYDGINIACWQWQVTFETGEGGSAVAPVSADHNAPIAAPEVPTKEGYTFDGWYNGSEAFDFATPITGNITLTAQWKLTTAISETALQPLRLYPNPVVNGLLTIDNEQWEEVKTIEIYSLVGTLAATKQITGKQTVINISQLPAGNYIVKAGKYTGKLIVQ